MEQPFAGVPANGAATLTGALTMKDSARNMARISLVTALRVGGPLSLSTANPGVSPKGQTPTIVA